MKSSFGKNIKVSIWGGSHQPAIGVDIEGLPVGTVIDMNELTSFLKRRAPGNSPLTTARKEADIPVAIAGLDAARQLTKQLRGNNDEPSPDHLLAVSGQKVSLEIRNTDTRSRDYKILKSIPRPGHADYTAGLRYGDTLNMAGGGPFSARMTAPLCIAGGIALQILAKSGIHVGAHIYSVADIYDVPFNATTVEAKQLKELDLLNFATIDTEMGQRMQEKISDAKLAGDSVGGIIEGCAVGLPAGIGGAMYDGVESVLSPILFGIPAVKGVEFGAGFGSTTLKGSENNDAFYYDGNIVKTRTNNHGGILGGITTGMPLIVRVAFKPTPSIAIKQASVDLIKKENTELIINGRHDPCVVTRAVPIVEAALALGILDCIMEANENVRP